MLSEPRRLHPLAMLFMFIKLLRSAIIPLIGVAVGAFNNFDEIAGLGTWIWGVFALLFVLFFILPSFFSWYRFTYRVEDGELKIEQGAFVKKHRYIRKERIQSIDRSAGVLHRPFGLVKIKIETAGGGPKQGAEGELSAITLEEARQLEAVLYGMEETVEEEKAPTGNAQRKLSPLYLLIAGATSGKIGAVLSILAAVFSQIDNFIPNHFYSDIGRRLLASGFQFLALLALLIAVCAWILAILGTVIRYAGFTLTRTEDELQIASGLLERRQLTLPVHRIQAIRIVEGLLRQPFGFVTLYVESAGGSGGKSEDFSTVLFPLLRKREVAAFLNEFAAGYPAESKFIPAPKRAVWQYLFRLVIPALIVVVPVVILVPWGTYSILLLLAAVILGLMQYRDAGWSFLQQFSILRFRNLSRTTVIVPRRNIQAGEVKQSYFQKKRELMTLQVSVDSPVAGKSFRVSHLDADTGNQLMDWYGRKK
ncbi:MAG TPA: PH domain-containing protein [Bacillales bacterium]